MIGRRPDAGAIAGLEALAFGSLILVTGTLLIVNAWAVVDAKFAVAAAAREATRAIVEAPATDTVERARVRGVRAAEAAFAGHGRTRQATVDVVVEHARPGASLERCARVTTTVSTSVPALFLPFVGAIRSEAFDVRASHSERVDPFRAGLARGGTCDG